MTDDAEALLLDTCAAIWLVGGDPLSPSAVQAVDRAATAGRLLVSPVTAWEIGLLSRPGRNASEFLPDPFAWFGRLVALRGVRETPLTPRIAIASSHLPGNLHPDPGDRMLIATARELGVPIVTRDRRILDYAAAGHVLAVAC